MREMTIASEAIWLGAGRIFLRIRKVPGGFANPPIPLQPLHGGFISKLSTASTNVLLPACSGRDRVDSSPVRPTRFRLRKHGGNHPCIPKKVRNRRENNPRKAGKRKRKNLKQISYVSYVF